MQQIHNNSQNTFKPRPEVSKIVLKAHILNDCDSTSDARTEGRAFKGCPDEH